MLNRVVINQIMNNFVHKMWCSVCSVFMGVNWENFKFIRSLFNLVPVGILISKKKYNVYELMCDYIMQIYNFRILMMKIPFKSMQTSSQYTAHILKNKQ